MFLIVRTASDQDVYAKDRGIAHNPRETEEHKEVRSRVLRVASDPLSVLRCSSPSLAPGSRQHAREEIRKMVEAERHTAAGLKGTILNVSRSSETHRKGTFSVRFFRAGALPWLG